ncbi:MAG: hypothetical protein ACOYL8_01025 [Patescibacteria group bacterium]
MKRINWKKSQAQECAAHGYMFFTINLVDPRAGIFNDFYFKI